MKELLEKAKAWALIDFDENTKKELLALIEKVEYKQIEAKELAARFSGFLEFGTAGLRGEIGAGESRMNLMVVHFATQGLAHQLLSKKTSPPTLVVGNDARHMSEEFANEVCRVATHLGLKVFQLPSQIPTPLLAFSVKVLKADAGVMITASHNPPKDNGYKVYDEFGAGIIPPQDKEIALAISEHKQLLKFESNLSWEKIDTKKQYLSRLKQLVPKIEHKDLKIAYTPMHGVGAELFLQATDNLNLTQVFVVSEQAQPDPTFKTVAFPNPEEPGACDLLLKLAEKIQADIAIAHDPDADRCAIGIKENNSWRMLKGDELGILLAWWIMQKADLAKESVFSSSIVSASLVPKMAEQLGFKGQSTLTGMKWAGHIENLAFGYEEAIGYSVDPVAVSDKDGISAALVMIEMMDWCKGENLTLTNVLDDIYKEFGLHLTGQLSIRLNDIDLAKEKVQELLTDPPKDLNNETVVEVIDMQEGYKNLPPSKGIVLKIQDGSIIVRPSGTEPKLKCYLEVKGESSQKALLQKRLTDLSNAMAVLLN